MREVLDWVCSHYKAPYEGCRGGETISNESEIDDVESVLRDLSEHRSDPSHSHGGNRHGDDGYNLIILLLLLLIPILLLL